MPLMITPANTTVRRYAEDYYTDISGGIFDTICFGQTFRPRDLIRKFRCIRHLSQKVQLEILQAVCKSLTIEHTDDNHLLVKVAGIRYQVPLK